jgi:DNA-binding CsgD family transcriptional regulator
MKPINSVNKIGNSNSRKRETSLTPKEVEILVKVAGGATNEKIAEELCIGANKVDIHVGNTFKKIKACNRLEAALWAAKNL